MSWVTVGNTDIHYEDQGDRNAPPLVFIHGNNSGLEGWYQHVEAFRRAYHVYAFDSVNHGLSANSPLDEVEPDRAAELQGFLDAMSISRPVLVGHSMGGSTVMRWASRHPDAAAALVVSGSGVAPGPATTPAPLVPLPVEELIVPTGDDYSERFLREEPEKFQRYRRLRSTATRLEALRHPRQRYQPSPVGEEFAAVARQIVSPLLLLVGAEDAAVRSARHAHELLPQSQLIEFAGLKHNFFWEAPHLYIDAMDAFLEKLSLPTSKVAVAT